MLVISMTMLGLATLVFGLSDSVTTYLIGVALFGFHAATYSGLNDSIVYDTLLEVQGSRSGFERYFGRTRTYASIAMVAGSLAGGLAAKQFGLHQAYLLSLPSCLFAILTAMTLQEPSQHQQNEATYLVNHIKETFQHILRKGPVSWVLISMISLNIMAFFLLEVDQLWPIALALPLVWYGPLNALLLLGYGLGGSLAGFAASKRSVALVSCGFGLLCVLALSIRNMPLIAISQFGIICFFSALFVIANGKFHDMLPSRLRAGASSIVSTMTTLCFIPLVLLFGHIAQNTSVFTASYMLVPIALIGLFSYLGITRFAPR